MCRPKQIIIVILLFLLSAAAAVVQAQTAELDRANSLNDQMSQLYRQGRYAEAITLAQEVLTIREKALGPEHPDVAESLNNLATLYQATGAYAQAEPLYQRALAIFEKALGPNHPDVAWSLNNLAAFYHATGAYTQAEPLYKRALAIREKILGPEHPDVALTLNNLAALYNDTGAYTQAEPLYKRALAIREKTLGPNHPDVALTLNNLATLYNDTGAYTQAEPLLERALTIWEKALGPNHPHVAASLNNLAVFLSARDQEKKALPLFLRAQGITEKLIDQVMGFTSEDRKTQFLAQNQTDFEAALNVVAFHLNQDQQVRREGLDLWLRRKGVILEAQKRYQEALFYTDNPEAVRLAQELAQVRARLSRQAFGGPGKEGLEAYRHDLAELDKEKERLEAELARFSQAFARRQMVKKADSRQVAAALPPDTVLLEFVQLGQFNFKAKGREPKWSAPHYLAFVLPAGQPDKIELTHLGEAKPIDEAIAAFKKAATDLNDTRRLAATDESRRLYDLVFAKIAPYLGASTEIFISPDGNLNLIPFEVLQGPDGKYLIEKYNFNYLASGRDLLSFGQLQGQAGKSILIGDPDFALTPSAKAIQLKRLGLKAEEGGLRSTELRGLLFTPLPNTRLEIERVADILGKEHCALYLGDQALEEVLFQARSPRILHLSTHGFFLKDEDLARLVPGLDQRGFAVSPFSDRPQAPAVKFENPLLRSGLALAGANEALTADRLTASDGLLTAEKVLGLKLIGTEVVVLSACSTGLGDVRNGEGVYGLRRAFVQAGTQGLVMSMWNVPDKETQELMVQFYRNLQAGLPRSQALRQAALKEMQIVRGRYGQAYPMFWGAFVFLGDPGRK
ncbi:MAG: CHAT domain-containing tetratricopeptide repeat protein [Pseudomonadota bacterium]